MASGVAPMQECFFGHDHYAREALDSGPTLGTFADGDLHVAGRGLADTVIPDVDEAILKVTGQNEDEAREVATTLLTRRYEHELWNEPSFPMELRSYVTQLVEYGDVYVHFQFSQDSVDSRWLLTKATWLAPETILRRSNVGIFEQYVSKRAFERAGYVVVGEPSEHLYEIPEDEVMHLHWPFHRSRPPSVDAMVIGRDVERGAERSLFNARAGAYPDEMFWSIARARAGAYSNALKEQEIASARIKDSLFYPGAYESEVFPWAPKLTDYFAAERIIRAKIAICQLRQYILDEFNKQVLAKWSRVNQWGPVQLGLAPELFSEADWQQMLKELEEGCISLDDIRAASQVEFESAVEIRRTGVLAS